MGIAVMTQNSQTRGHNRRKVFDKAREDANPDSLIIKDSRRHQGIVLLENGAEMHIIQAMLGHASVKITEEHCAHLSPPDTTRRAFQVLQRSNKGGINRLMLYKGWR